MEGRALSVSLAGACVLLLLTAAVSSAAAVELDAPILFLPALGASGLAVVLLRLANLVHDQGR